MSDGTDPDPVRRTRAAQAFFARVASGRPGIPFCLGCQRSFFYPRPRCPHCHGNDITLREPTAPLSVRTHIWVARPQSAEFLDGAPILLVVAESHGASIIAEGHGWNRSRPPRAGDPVRFVTLERANGTHVPVFVPAEVTGSNEPD